MLNSPVLVLNRSYLPVHVTSVRRAFSLVYQGIARVVDGEYRTFDFEQWSGLRVLNRNDRRHNGHEHRAMSSGDVAHTGRPMPDGPEWIGSSRGHLPAPRVILLTVFDRMPRRHVRFSRVNVMTRDGFTCQYCGERPSRSQLNLDHVVPRAHGGRSTWENVVVSCLDCNRRKGGRTPEQAGLRLLRAPARPRWTPLATLPLAHIRHDEWRPFLRVVEGSFSRESRQQAPGAA
jgi:5-methylcytosine-specific restriction endonuclease McrA